MTSPEGSRQRRSAELFDELRHVLRVIQQTQIIAGLEIDAVVSEDRQSLLSSLEAQHDHFDQLAQLYITAAELLYQQQQLWGKEDQEP